MERKYKILLISDHPLISSGVGLQAKYLIEGLLETGRYKFICFGGAIKHPDYKPQMVAPEKFGEGNWIIIPVDGHGDKDMLRRVLYYERPDAVVIFTDPRFFYWIWEVEDEIRSVCPLLYWHVWDGDPHPEFNRIFYDSTDFIAALSLKTYGTLQGLEYPKEKFSYIPHALPDQLFKPLPDDEVTKFKAKNYGPHADKKFIVMWNNRNARRKATGDVIDSFARFATKVGMDNVALFMHTAARDPEGQDIVAVAKKFGVDRCIMISEDRVEPGTLNFFYNVADCTINIANAEGFGLSTLESLYAGTPIVAHMIGGLQFQMGDWWEGFDDFSSQKKMTEIARRKWRSRSCRWWGVPIFPAVRNCVGSQQVPYIYEEHADNDDVADALVKLYEMGRPARRRLGLEAREWATRTFDLQKMIASWDDVLAAQIEKFDRDASRIRVAKI